MATSTHNFALPGTFASGSQRKSCREISKATRTPMVRAIKSVMISLLVARFVAAFSRPVARYVAGMKREAP